MNVTGTCVFACSVGRPPMLLLPFFYPRVVHVILRIKLSSSSYFTTGAKVIHCMFAGKTLEQGYMYLLIKAPLRVYYGNY